MAIEPIGAIALSLALGAGAVAGKEVVNSLVKDAYSKLKDLIKARYPKISIADLERDPKGRLSVVEEDLNNAGAGQDDELWVTARRLTALIREHAPNAAASIGVDVKDVEAANLRLAGIVASGTGAKVERSRFSGDIEIRDVRAGMPPSDVTKSS
jgi:hypothetical protein